MDKVDEKEQKNKNEVGETDTVDLPIDFFLNLLDLPACKSKGKCDNCGRCTH